MASPSDRLAQKLLWQCHCRGGSGQQRSGALNCSRMSGRYFMDQQVGAPLAVCSRGMTEMARSRNIELISSMAGMSVTHPFATKESSIDRTVARHNLAADSMRLRRGERTQNEVQQIPRQRQGDTSEPPTLLSRAPIRCSRIRTRGGRCPDPTRVQVTVPSK